MDVVVEDVSALTMKITITLPKDGVQKKLEKAYGKLQRETKMKGFRRGKVPRTVIVKHYQGQVQAEVGEQLVQDSYFDAIEKRKLILLYIPKLPILFLMRMEHSHLLQV